MILNISVNTITGGTPITFNGDAISSSVTMLDPTKVLVAYSN
jgi:hypothetical protein